MQCNVGLAGRAQQRCQARAEELAPSVKMLNVNREQNVIWSRWCAGLGTAGLQCCSLDHSISGYYSHLHCLLHSLQTRDSLVLINVFITDSADRSQLDNAAARRLKLGSYQHMLDMARMAAFRLLGWTGVAGGRARPGGTELSSF